MTRQPWNKVHFTGKQIVTATRLRGEGYSWRRIAEVIGCKEAAIQFRLDPVFAAKETKRLQKHGDVSAIKMTSAEAARLIASVKPDTRGKVARWMGDPPAGRSALDMRQAPVPTVSRQISSYPR